MSLNAVIFPTGTYTVTRTAAGTYTNGKYTAGAASTFPIVADVQPVSGELLRDLPEGRRAEETRVLFTLTELRALKPTTDSDVVAIDGESWRVFKVERFRIFANRYRAWVERVGT